MGALEGQRALVTGAGRGIGAAIARRLAADGADLLVADIDADAAAAVAAQVDGRALALDVTDPDAVYVSLQSVGTLSILVNNAGVDDFDYFTDTTPQRWRRLIEVNLEGVLACTHAALPAMQAAGYGRLVNVASEAGRLGSKGNAVYAATKAAVIAFTKSIARENARYRITANAVAPGPTETPLLDATRRLGPQGARIVEKMTAATELRRLAAPQEIAAAVGFLASPDASYITGETLGVSGGMGMG